jgi:cytochrome P450
MRMPYVVRTLRGRLAYNMLEVHERYGPVVRIAPNELALAYKGVWDEVQGGAYGNEMPKRDAYYKVQNNQVGFIMTAPPADHAQMRRVLSHGFSDRGLRDVEPRMIAMLDKMTDRLMSLCTRPKRLRRKQATTCAKIPGEATVDIAKWCNFLTFDMIGELAFGQSYGCLETGASHPWVKPTVELTHYSGIVAVLGRRMVSHQEHRLAALEKCCTRQAETDLLSEALRQARISKDVSDSPDSHVLIVCLLIHHQPQAWNKLVMNASVLGVAGSETTATTLTTALYFLLTNPDTYQKLLMEVRGAFENEAEMTINAVNKLDYMLACLSETTRMLPAVPGGLPRVVPHGGRVLNGARVPEKVYTSIPSLILNAI